MDRNPRYMSAEDPSQGSELDVKFKFRKDRPAGMIVHCQQPGRACDSESKSTLHGSESPPR